MKFDFTVPMTSYEFIAIILAVAALIIPLIKWLWTKFVKQLKLDFIPSGMITLYHNRSGSYISLGGVYEAKNKSTTIKEISAKVVRKADNATLPLIWSTFPSPVFRRVAGNFETSFETAHPFRVEADTLAPAFVEFSNITSTMDQISNDILSLVISASMPIFSQPNIALFAAHTSVNALPEYSTAKIALNEYFFWKPGIYELVLSTTHSNGLICKKYEVSLSDEESLSLRSNIDKLLIAHVADHFRIPLQMNSVRKEFKESI